MYIKKVKGLHSPSFKQVLQFIQQFLTRYRLENYQTTYSQNLATKLIESNGILHLSDLISLYNHWDVRSRECYQSAKRFLLVYRLLSDILSDCMDSLHKLPFLSISFANRIFIAYMYKVGRLFISLVIWNEYFFLI